MAHNYIRDLRFEIGAFHVVPGLGPSPILRKNTNAIVFFLRKIHLKLNNEIGQNVQAYIRRLEAQAAISIDLSTNCAIIITSIL